MSEHTPLTGQPILDAAATEPQQGRISNRLLEMQSVKPPKSCSTLQGYKNVLSGTLSRLVTSSTVCIHSARKKLLATFVSDRHITRWVERISELVLPQLWKQEKLFYIMLP